MINRISLGRSTQILIVANLALAMIVGAQLLLPVQARIAPDAGTKSGDAVIPDFSKATIAAPPIGQLVDMMERPLFFPDRRMPEPEAEQAPAAPLTPLRLKLEGIAIAGGARIAVLRNLNGNALMQLTEGETHDGWTLNELSSNSATFSRGAQTNELLLDPGTGR